MILTNINLSRGLRNNKTVARQIREKRIGKSNIFESASILAFNQKRMKKK